MFDIILSAAFLVVLPVILVIWLGASILRRALHSARTPKVE